jgi:hypothetical protein
VAIALGANSPTFLGHRLWDETRIALFKQAMDDRPSDQGDWHAPGRVSIGHGWVRHGAYEAFAETVGLFPVLLPVMGAEEPLAVLRAGGRPALTELRLHQSTVWRWNRAIYDPGAGGHLRIEMRALPAGPTPQDMMANAAFLIGMTLGLRTRAKELLPSFPFDYAKYNFYRAAQHGLDAELLWPSTEPPSPRQIPVSQLALELLPLAKEGLTSFGVEDEEIQRHLGVIHARITSGITGARWQRGVLEQLDQRLCREDALVAMLEAYMGKLAGGKPVAEWSTQP